ncbi:unnamed protein product [Zymoseptoria tritici ST99CH_1E4]|uniref:ubiquitinyl hydrolase 1 n=1 Tax=Zymoseptoria tritici ST99CH_1E4 TaxID=1276532 RepID=A0A2H1GQF1_ZYMTR|nr:unnamed protein product [Zymoseptoria tritici ST99CH_1E4]
MTDQDETASAFDGMRIDGEGRFSSYITDGEIPARPQAARLTFDVVDFRTQLVEAQDELPSALREDLEDFCKCATTCQQFVDIVKQVFPVLAGFEDALGEQTTEHILRAAEGRIKRVFGSLTNDRLDVAQVRKWFNMMSAAVARSDVEIAEDTRNEVALMMRGIFALLGIQPDPELVRMSSRAKSFGSTGPSFTNQRAATLASDPATLNEPKASANAPLPVTTEKKAIGSSGPLNKLAAPSSINTRTNAATQQSSRGRKKSLAISELAAQRFNDAAAKESSDATQTGLINLGNSCFMNGVFQHMLASEGFMNSIMVLGDGSVLIEGLYDRPLGSALLDMFPAIRREDYASSVTSLHMVEYAINQHPNLQDYAEVNNYRQQQDPTEFFQFVILRLLKPYMDAFLFHTQNLLICARCGNTRNGPIQPSHHYNLKIPENADHVDFVEQMAIDQTTPETTSAKTHCGKCGTAETIGRIEKIVDKYRGKAPPPFMELAVHTSLELFDRIKGKTAKTHASIPIPDGPFPILGSFNSMMRGDSVVQHQGLTVSDGHYLASSRPSPAAVALRHNNDWAKVEKELRLWTLYNDSEKIPDRTMAQVEATSWPPQQHVMLHLSAVTKEDYAVYANVATRSTHAATIEVIDNDLKAGVHPSNWRSIASSPLEEELTVVLVMLLGWLHELPDYKQYAQHEINISKEVWWMITSENIANQDARTIEHLAKELTTALLRTVWKPRDSAAEIHSNFLGEELAEALTLIAEDSIKRYKKAAMKVKVYQWRCEQAQAGTIIEEPFFPDSDELEGDDDREHSDEQPGALKPPTPKHRTPKQVIPLRPSVEKSTPKKPGVRNPSPEKPSPDDERSQKAISLSSNTSSSSLPSSGDEGPPRGGQPSRIVGGLKQQGSRDAGRTTTSEIKMDAMDISGAEEEINLSGEDELMKDDVEDNDLAEHGQIESGGKRDEEETFSPFMQAISPFQRGSSLLQEQGGSPVQQQGGSPVHQGSSPAETEERSVPHQDNGTPEYNIGEESVNKQGEPPTHISNIFVTTQDSTFVPLFPQESYQNEEDDEGMMDFGAFDYIGGVIDSDNKERTLATEIDQNPYTGELVMESIEERLSRKDENRRVRTRTPGGESLNPAPRQKRREKSPFSDSNKSSTALFERFRTPTPLDRYSTDSGLRPTSAVDSERQKKLDRRWANLWKLTHGGSVVPPAPAAELWPRTQENTFERQLGWGERVSYKHQVTQRYQEQRVEGSEREFFRQVEEARETGRYTDSQLLDLLLVPATQETEAPPESQRLPTGPIEEAEEEETQVVPETQVPSASGPPQIGVQDSQVVPATQETQVVPETQPATTSQSQSTQIVPETQTRLDVNARNTITR